MTIVDFGILIWEAPPTDLPQTSPAHHFQLPPPPGSGDRLRAFAPYGSEPWQATLPLPMDDARRAVRLIRSRAAEFHIAPNRIGLMGFPAGGHLASTVITHLDAGNPSATDPIDKVSARPDFAILVYPVITLVKEEFVHKGSRSNLTADDRKLWPELSSELHVSKETPPVFLIHGGMDKGVPPENSMMFAEACRKAGVSVELHVLSHGEHAFRDEAVRAESYECLQRWLARNGWLH